MNFMNAKNTHIQYNPVINRLVNFFLKILASHKTRFSEIMPKTFGSGYVCHVYPGFQGTHDGLYTY